MFTILGLVGWIVLDVAMFLVTTPPRLSPWVWYGFLGVGLIVGVLALIGEIRDRGADAKRDADLKAGQEQHSREHDILAAAAIKTLEIGPNFALLVQKLEGFTNTHGAPIGETIAVANTTIETLQAEISDLKSMFWRRLTDVEKAGLRKRVAAIGSYKFRIRSAHPADCNELASDLAKVLDSAEWQRAEMPTHLEQFDLDNRDLADTSGIRIVGKYPADDEPGAKLLDALKPLIKGGLGFGAPLYSGDPADVVIFVGPKGARSVLPEK
jgi:hypothetical protein